jgi:ketosteroid isomerase-like protein
MKTNLEIVKSTYEGGSPEETSKNTKVALAEDAAWTEAAGFPYAGTYIGFEAIAKNVFEKLATEWIDYKITIEDYVVDGDKIMAFGTYSGTYKATNKYFEARVAHLWKLKEGKIIRFEQFVDSKTVFDALK